MRSRFERGSAIEEVLILVALLAVIFLFIIPGKTPSLIDATSPSTGSGSYSSSSSEPSGPAFDSIYAQYVTLGIGSALSATEPHLEYVIITNRFSIPVNITDWKLVGRIDEIVIPKGSRLIPTGHSNRHANIVLAPGESAFITTGPMDTRAPHIKGTETPNTWWAFANRNWETWSRQESIELRDRWGKAVTSITY